MKRNLKALLSLGALVANSAFATEMRTPWISERGPLRYTFEKLHNEEGKFNLNYWSVIHGKEAHKAFLKHGTDTEPLTALIFNKADFRLAEIFPNSDVPVNSENFNPFMKIVKISPRVKYLECGMTFGGRFDYPVWETKGRIGLRATVPLRRIEMQREDFDNLNDDALEEIVSEQVRTVTRPNNALTGDSSDGTLIQPPKIGKDVVTRAWRFDFVQAIMNPNHTSIVNFPATNVQIFNNAIGTDSVDKVCVGLTGATEGSKPQMGSFQYADFAAPNSALAPALNEAKFPVGPQAEAAAYNKLAAVPVGSSLASFNVPEDKVSWFSNASDYRGLDINNTANNPFFVTPPTVDANGCITSCVSSCAPRPCPKPCTDPCSDTASTLADKLASSWLIFRYDHVSNEDDAINVTVAQKIDRVIAARANAFKESHLDFLEQNNFSLNSQTRNGLADIDLDLFYEHTFCEHFIGELMVGVRFPTGGNNKKCDSPYRPILGNGGHWEVKLGGLFAWQPADWVNLKLDAYYSFVLEKTEDRMAAFQGAQIKNFGPCTKADVDWGYFVGRLDFNFFHPKTSDIRSTIGYEFYYKTKDDVHFKCKSIESWLGKKFNTTTQLLEANPALLDNCLAEKNTESIGHKVRAETSCQINKWFEIFAGGTFTFAGQNVFADRDAHCGFNIRF